MLHSMLVVRKCSGSLHVPYYWQHRALLALRATALHSEPERHVRSLRPKATSWLNTTNINENCQILCPSTNTLCVWHCVTQETSPLHPQPNQNSATLNNGNTATASPPKPQCWLTATSGCCCFLLNFTAPCLSCVKKVTLKSTSGDESR